jgi:hypothetical protein
MRSVPPGAPAARADAAHAHRTAKRAEQRQGKTEARAMHEEAASIDASGKGILEEIVLRLAQVTPDLR